MKSVTKIIQFYRNFRQFTGGHLKHWHYFNHCFYASGYLPYIYFGADTVWSDRNPWNHLRQGRRGPSVPLKKPDILFVEGVSDWPVVLDTYPNLNQYPLGQIPVINLIQGVRHAEPNDPRYAFLGQRAIRICVSQAIQTALEATKRVNGPLLTIPCAMELTELPLPLKPKNNEICIAALKNPELGRRLKQKLEQAGYQVTLLAERMPRFQFLKAINQSKICVFLPCLEEGFYLPALEGMALNTLVICPDCIGNREFCRDGKNCFRPNYKEVDLLTAIEQAQALSAEATHDMLKLGQVTVRGHGLRSERKAFLELLANVEQLW